MWNGIEPLVAGADEVNSDGFIFIVQLLDYQCLGTVSVHLTLCWILSPLMRGVPYLSPLWYADTRWRSWSRDCPTSRQVAGSNPDVIGIFH